jgi:hypothetical protein
MRSAIVGGALDAAGRLYLVVDLFFFDGSPQTPALNQSGLEVGTLGCAPTSAIAGVARQGVAGCSRHRLGCPPRAACTPS